MNKVIRNRDVLGTIGTFDRIARVVVGLAALLSLLFLAISGSQEFSYPMMVSAIVVLSGIAGWDPLYAIKDAIFGRKTGAMRRPGNIAQTPA
ncbi:MAG: DUF2892 domain-containing protein [Gammaproteobacteria bacterium]|nr:DUF2892 domain-containing protein [Gammaproteobacteria bacterium]